MNKYFDRGFARVFRAVTILFLGVAQTLHADDAKQKPLMKDFIGINGHLGFKGDLYQPICSRVRNYHSLVWDLGKDTSSQLDFPQSHAMLNDTPVNWLDLYGGWEKHGFRIDDCLRFEAINPDGWKDMEKDAYAYAETYAKYFGPSNHTWSSRRKSEMKPRTTTTPPTERFPKHGQRLRAGDPKLKIVTCAAAASNPDIYSKDVSCIAGLEDLYDVLNVHTYSFIEHSPSYRRTYPEHPDIPYLKVVDEMISWRNAHVPGKEIWITEFGYDANSKPPAPGSKWVSSTETEQAQWLVRSFLIFSAMDVDAAYLYFFDDNDEASVHASSGITRHFQPKAAYYALAHLQKTLGDYRFSKIIIKKEPTKKDEARADHPKKDETNKDDPLADDANKDAPADDNGPLYVYEYVNPDKPTEPIWAAWLPTGSQHEATRKSPSPARSSRPSRCR